RYMDKNKLCDVMIVGRGGGSIEDLWAFNEEVVARAIYESETPIVSAVGHETDFSIADFVADMRAPTPSAAAELCVPLYESLTETVSKYHGIINRSVEGALALQKSRLSSLMSSAVLASPKNVLQNCRVKLGNYSVLMTESVKNKIEIAVQEYAGADARLNALSPLNVLDRGYAIIKSGENYITDVSKMNVGDEADIVMRDGTVTVTVKEIKGKNK
ncbi:MAG: exodeoxyribonuclease VII large subunit, partial [Clostridia bacterium]|nr:exodeoxyribonuclease VII large subunit [Clostridia bacterium]